MPSRSINQLQSEKASQGQVPCITIVSEPGTDSLVRAIGLLSLARLTPLSIRLRHTGQHNCAVCRISLLESSDPDSIRIAATKIGQLPTVSSVRTRAHP